MEADMVVTVAELGKELFYELKLLEPCGMGNPVPKLLIQNCWFEEVWNRNTQDLRGQKVQYIKTEFEIWDDSSSAGFPGIWWGHYKDEVPKGRCDALVELDYNNSKKRPEVRLLAVRSNLNTSFNIPTQVNWILDWRGEDGEMGREREFSNLSASSSNSDPLTVRECPTSWDELQVWFRRAMQSERKLAIAYPPPKQLPSVEIWQQLVGIAKFLSRTGQAATLKQLQDKLDISDRTLHVGLNALSLLGFQVKHSDWTLILSLPSTFAFSEAIDPATTHAILDFLLAIEEEQFRRQYFYQVPLSTIQSQALQTAVNV
jgi:single-stranded-DNA-specific exonuclease